MNQELLLFTDGHIDHLLTARYLAVYSTTTNFYLRVEISKTEVEKVLYRLLNYRAIKLHMLLLLRVFGVEQLFVGRVGGVVGLSCFEGTNALRIPPSLLSSVANCNLYFMFTSVDITILVGIGLEPRSATSGSLINWGNNVFFSAVIDSLIYEF